MRMHVPPRPSSWMNSDQQPFTVTGGREAPTSLLPLLLSATKPQSPAFWCHQGQRGQASRAVGDGQGRTPLPCCPSLLYWDEPCDLHTEEGAVGGEGFQEVVHMAGKF